MPDTVKIMPKRKPAPATHATDLVAVLAYDGLCTFEFGLAVEVFGLPRPELTGWYRFAVAAIEPGPLRAIGGIRVSADGGLETLAEAGTIIVPGWRGAETLVPPDLLDALRTAHARGARLVSICSGVFVLAATGLLDGRRATTHWRYAEKLAALYPAINVEPDVLYVDEGDLLTSAGSAAGLDLALHIVRTDHGARIANQVARRLVVPPHREGGQTQFAPQPLPPEGARFTALFDWMRQHLHEPLTVETLAAHVAMSRRSFIRRFGETAGLPPGEWLLRERLQRARDLLEASDRSVEQIAFACGFGSTDTLRHHFRERLKVSPAAYRKTFGDRRISA